LNVGFSYLEGKNEVHGTEDAAKHIVNFFENLLKAHPQFKNVNFYLFGESYAGHYIPVYAASLLK